MIRSGKRSVLAAATMIFVTAFPAEILPMPKIAMLLENSSSPSFRYRNKSSGNNKGEEQGA